MSRCSRMNLPCMASPSVKPPHPVRNFRLRPTHYCYDTSSVETKPMKATCLSGLCIQRGWERWRSSNPFSSPILSSFLLSPTQSNHFPQRFSRQVVQLPLFVIEGQGARISSKARYGFALHVINIMRDAALNLIDRPLQTSPLSPGTALLAFKGMSSNKILNLLHMYTALGEMACPGALHGPQKYICVNRIFGRRRRRRSLRVIYVCVWWKSQPLVNGNLEAAPRASIALCEHVLSVNG